MLRELVPATLPHRRSGRQSMAPCDALAAWPARRWPAVPSCAPPNLRCRPSGRSRRGSRSRSSRVGTPRILMLRMLKPSDRAVDNAADRHRAVPVGHKLPRPANGGTCQFHQADAWLRRRLVEHHPQRCAGRGGEGAHTDCAAAAGRSMKGVAAKVVRRRTSIVVSRSGGGHQPGQR